jgi:hypothetical protein
MENSKHSYSEDNKLRFAAVAYYAVMLGAFAVGLYGLLSLLWLASAEIQHSVQILPPLS